jgi:hypothetical protein
MLGHCGGARRPLRPPPGTPSTRPVHAENQGRQPGRRARRRRDDAHHLAPHPRQVHPAVPRHRARILRPWRREPRCDRRPGDGGGRRGHQAPRGRRQMRHHHARRGPGGGVRAEADVALAQRHHPQHPRRGDLSRADHLPQCAAPGAGLDRADHHRPPCLRRPVPRHRLPLSGQGQADGALRGRGRQGHRARGLLRRRARAWPWPCTTSTTRSATSPAPR